MAHVSRRVFSDRQLKNGNYMKKLLIIVLLLTIVRLYPILNNQYCFSDDCPAYLNVITDKNSFQEPLFWFISKGLYNMGLDEIMIMKMFTFFLPVFFSIGLYILLRDRVKNHTLYVILIATNTILTINLFWFVLVRNGLMLVFLPFFLHYYIKKNYNLMMLTMFLMALSHISFFIFTIPLAIHLLKKDRKQSFVILLITMMFVGYYSLSYQAQITTNQLTNLSYFQMDAFFLFISILGLVYIKKKSYNIFKYLFIFGAIITLMLFLTSIESYRSLFLLNIPVLLFSSSIIDRYWRNRVFKFLIIIYLVFSCVFFFVYNVSLESITQGDVEEYYQLSKVNGTVSIGDAAWIKYFTGNDMNTHSIYD